jgi:hypothetical protein
MCAGAGESTIHGQLRSCFEPGTERGTAKSYDVIIVEYVDSHCDGSQVLQLFYQTLQEMAVIFLTPGLRSESIGEFTAEGSFGYVEQEHIAHLVMVVRWALNHNAWLCVQRAASCGKSRVRDHSYFPRCFSLCGPHPWDQANRTGKQIQSRSDTHSHIHPGKMRNAGAIRGR